MGAMFVLVGFMFAVGIIYPLFGVIYYKSKGDKRSIGEIIDAL